MIPRCFPRVLTFCALLATTAAPGLLGQIVLDDFNDGNDTGWTHLNPLGNAVYSFPGGNTYAISAPKPGTNTFGSARAGAYLTGSDFADFHVTVDLVDWDNSSDTHQAIGIFGRGQEFGLGATDGYFFHYDPYGSGGNANIWIDIVTDEAPSGNVSLSVTRFDPDEDYRLEFIGSGDQLTGRVYAMDDLVNALYEITFTDSTYTSGAVGLLVADQGSLSTGNQSGAATFDNFSTGAIPEPSTTALLIGIGGLAAAVYRRRK